MCYTNPLLQLCTLNLFQFKTKKAQIKKERSFESQEKGLYLLSLVLHGVEGMGIAEHSANLPDWGVSHQFFMIFSKCAGEYFPGSVQGQVGYGPE